MRKRSYMWVGLLLICLMVVAPLAVQAAPVGTFIEVEGTVDLLKAGKPPAVPVKVQGPVEVGDLVRTKSQARAQIRFVDDTVLTIAPDSGITIEEYMFDAVKSQRKAVVGVLRGLVHTSVEKVYPKAQPDFIMKTHTAVLGVRGTKWYTKLSPLGTGVYTEGSKLQVQNIDPRFPLIRLMKDYQFVWVGWFMNATAPVDITKNDLKPLEKQMHTGIGAGLTDFGPPGLAGRQWPPLSPKYSGERSQVEYLGSGFYVPPRIAPPIIQQPPPQPITPQQPYEPSGGSPGFPVEP